MNESIPYSVTEASQAFSKILLRWYERHKRDLPWRETKDPYQIWLSEIILQQTRVAQGLPYFQKFVSRFPDVSALATASQEEVLALWQGLGYYSRARNLHACAQMVVSEFDGKFPSTYARLLRLKGVGAYTAAAIASFAFDEPVPVIDGNVYRVAARVFGIYNDVSNAASRKVFEKALHDVIPAGRPGDFNQAIMEFGALQCTPGIPDCASCDLQSSCHAFRNNTMATLPVKTKKVKVLTRYFNYFVFESEGDVLLNVRRDKDIWLGLHDFYNIERDRQLTEAEALASLEDLIASKKWELLSVSETYKHVLTHRIIYARFFRVKVFQKNDFNSLAQQLGLKPITVESIESISKPVLIANYLTNNFL